MTDLSLFIKNIKPTQVRSYLSRNNWQTEDYSRNQVIKFKNSDDPSFILFVPTKIDSGDYITALKKVIDAVSFFEKIDPMQAIKKIVSPDQDVISFRLKGAFAEQASLPLDIAIDSIKNIQDSLIYSACSEVQTPQPFYPRKLKHAINVTKEARFGQTQPGSFIINLELPLERQIGQNEESTNEPPILRRVSNRIFKGLQKAQSIAFDNVQLGEDDYKTGLNSNLADALYSLYKPELGIEIELVPTWSSSIHQSELALERPLILDKVTFESIKSIGNILRSGPVVREVDILGTVVGLSREDFNLDEDDQEANDSLRNVTIKPENADNFPCRSFKVSLSSVDYESACDAHKLKRKIKIKGRLEKLGKYWTLTDYTLFEFVDI